MRRRAAFGRAALACGAALAGPAAAQPAAPAAWPTRPIRWLLGFAPGGAGDITARLIAPRLAAALGQPVLIENRPSAGSIVAADAVARAEPDGHTLLLVSSTTSAAAAIYRSLPFDTLRDFADIGLMSTFEHFVLTAADAPWRTLAEAIAALRRLPGQGNIGSIGVGTNQHLSAELFRAEARLESEMVTYRGTPDLLNAIATGDVQLGIENLPPVLGQLGPGGRLRALAIASPERALLQPEVPTTREAGLPGYLVDSWNGIQAPARTPPAVLARLNAELNRVLAEPEIARRLNEIGLTPRPGPPGVLSARLEREIATWNRVIAGAGIARQ